MTKFVRVMSKGNKRNPPQETRYQLEHGADGSITILEDDKHGVGPAVRGSTFMVGDQAEYDSYNLNYVGQITKITEKTVTIQSYPGTQMAENHRLSMYEFCWRNHKFDAVRVAAQNANTMMYI